MELAISRTAAPQTTASQERPEPFGASGGVSITPGVRGDSWAAPPPVRLSDGTRLHLFKDGQALRAAFQAIQAAKRLICLEVYIFASDATGQAFARLLSDKARAGVRVYVVYDSFGSLYSDSAMFRAMRLAGVRLEEFHPIAPWRCNFGWRPFNRDHRKLLVVDGTVAGIGGLNIGGEYAGSWVVPSSATGSEPWRDDGVGIVGPAAGLFLHAFARTWNYVTHGGRIGRAFFEHHLPDGEIGVLASVATIDSPLRSSICRLLRSARRSIDLTMAYFAPDDGLVQELCGAALKGVRVRLMLPGRSDVPLVRIAGRSFYERLLGCGVEVYERQGVILHAKTMVVDGNITVVGSTNLDYRSIEYNCEISAVIRSGDFGRQMEQLFEHDMRSARRMELAEWRRRPYWDRFVQGAVSRARYLL